MSYFLRTRLHFLVLHYRLKYHYLQQSPLNLVSSLRLVVPNAYAFSLSVSLTVTASAGTTTLLANDCDTTEEASDDTATDTDDVDETDSVTTELATEDETTTLLTTDDSDVAETSALTEEAGAGVALALNTTEFVVALLVVSAGAWLSATGATDESTPSADASPETIIKPPNNDNVAIPATTQRFPALYIL